MNRRILARLEERGTSVLIGASIAASATALGALLVRSIIRLDLSWDVFAYHLPFAALHGGIRVPFELSELLRTRFEGFPPLPHFVQGVLWRTTGSVNATGVVGMLALLLFLWFCHTRLRAPWWLVSAVVLSAPLVIIHAASSYVDLFGNALLAVGAASVLYVLAYPERGDLRLLTCGILGVAGAAWSKYQLLPPAGLVWLALALAFLLPVPAVAADRKRAGLILFAGLLLASVPYAVNLVVHRNPFWPIRVPVLNHVLPWAEDARFSEIYSRPPALAGASQVSLFFRSFLEIGLPTSYPDRPRWVIDQGITMAHLRMGGFWWISVVAALVLMTSMAMRLDRRRGLLLTGGLFGVIGFVSVLPQSHELRYYLFLPLTWAAGIGLLFPEYRRRFPRSAPLVVLLCASLFGTMAWVNRQYYRPERIGWVQAAEALGAAGYWPGLSRVGVNCAVRMGPRSFLLTGPTLKEFSVREVAVEELCPDGSTVAAPEGIRPPTARATVLSGLPSGGGDPAERQAAARRELASGLAHLAAGRYVLASERAGQAASLFPRWQDPYRVICSSRTALGEREDAIYSCATTLTLGIDDPVARRELDAAMSAGRDTSPPKEAVRSPREWIALGQAAYREQRFEDSVEAAARALRKDPRLTEAWELVDAGNAAAGHPEDAARARQIVLGLLDRSASPR